MRRPTALFVAVEAVLIVVLLPVMINVATGGSAPAGLDFLHRIAWYVVAALAVTAVSLAVWRFTATSQASAAFRYSRFHRKTQRRRLLVTLAGRVDGELAKSLKDIPWIQPRLDLVPGAVTPSPHVLTADLNDHAPEDIRQSFEMFDRSLLILGAPGSGKSTLLLDLARRLLIEAAATKAPVPVLLGLDRWTAVPEDDRGRLPRWNTHRADAAYFARWCLSEMVDHNGIPRPLAKTWLDGDGVVLLFDGLDEMPERERRGFIAALDQVQRERGPLAMAVTCRTSDYADLRPHLTVQGALEIAPLDRVRIEALLARHHDGLSALRETLEADDALWDLLDSPLWLALLAAQVRAEGASESGTDRNPNGPRLMESYVSVALASRPFPSRRLVDPATLRAWLSAFAQAFGHGSLNWSRVQPTVRTVKVTGAASAWFLVGAASALIIPTGWTALSPIVTCTAFALVVAFGVRRLKAHQGDKFHVTQSVAAVAGFLVAAVAMTACVFLAHAEMRQTTYWLILAPILGIALAMAIYPALLSQEKQKPPARATSGTRRSRYMAADPEARAGITAFFTVVMGLPQIVMILAAGRAAAALTVGLIAGAIVQASVTAAHNVTGRTQISPAEWLIKRFGYQRTGSAAYAIYAAGFCCSPFTCTFLEPWVDGRPPTAVVQTACELVAVVVGFAAGRVVTHPTIMRPGVASAVARGVLSATGQIPFRLHRYLDFIVSADILRRTETGLITFRHATVAEHLRVPTRHVNETERY